MYYLDYTNNLIVKCPLGEMRIFSYSRFGHGLDYDMNHERIRVYFKTEEEMSFFALYWAGSEDRNETS